MPEHTRGGIRGGIDPDLARLDAEMADRIERELRDGLADQYLDELEQFAANLRNQLAEGAKEQRDREEESRIRTESRKAYLLEKYGSNPPDLDAALTRSETAQDRLDDATSRRLAASHGLGYLNRQKYDEDLEESTDPVLLAHIAREQKAMRVADEDYSSALAESREADMALSELERDFYDWRKFFGSPP